MIRYILVAACLLGSAGPAVAQTLDPAFEKDIVRFLELTGAQKLGAQMVEQVMRAVGQGMRQGNPNVPQRVVDVASEVARDLFTKEVGSLMPRMVAAYGKVLTHDEVRQLIAFYETPLGRRLIEVAPQLQQAGAQAGQEWAQALTPQLQQEIQTQLKAEGLIP